MDKANKARVKEMKQFIQHLHDSERGNFMRLTHILKKVHDEGVSYVKKFHLLAVTIKDCQAKMKRRMSFQELTDICKVHFDDYQFIDQLANFAAEEKATAEASEKEGTPASVDAEKPDPKLENGFTMYINLNKIKTLCDIVMNLTRLLEGKTITHANLVEIFTQKAHPETLPLNNQELMKHDPHLKKMLELIYTNVKSRFNVFGNAYRYLDFRNRMGVSQSDFERGLAQFGLHFPTADRRVVFNYLSEGCHQMSFDQFMRL